MTVGAHSSFRELGHTGIVRHPTPARRRVCLLGPDPSALLTRRRGLTNCEPVAPTAAAYLFKVDRKGQ